jgi:hypothetical protein
MLWMPPSSQSDQLEHQNETVVYQLQQKALTRGGSSDGYGIKVLRGDRPRSSLNHRGFTINRNTGCAPDKSSPP